MSTHLISAQKLTPFDIYTLMDKMARMQLLDNVCNWIEDFLTNIVTVLKLLVHYRPDSILDPVLYLVIAADVQSVRTENYMFKFVDDSIVWCLLRIRVSATELFRLLRPISGTVYRSTSHPRSHCQSSAVVLKHISSGAASRDYAVVPEKWHCHFWTR